MSKELTARQATDLAVVEDNPLVLLPPQLASQCVPRYKTWTDPEYGFDQKFCGYSLPATLDAAAAMAILEQFESALAPAPVQRIASELARIRVLTKGRNLDDADAELTVAAFAEELAEYPGELVVSTLRYWPRRSDWFPSWMELQNLLRLRGGRILAMREALRERSARREPAKGQIAELERDLGKAMRMDR